MARRSSRRRVWLHRTLALVCVALAYPAIRWWRDSILFVILLSLATQASTSWGAAEAADDDELARRLDRIEALLRD
jgi:hypothetical protein